MTNKDLKVSVLFFSATGNSKRLAEQIASNFKNTTLVDITHQLDKPIALTDYDMLFIVVPVYSQLLPSPIKEYIKKLHIKGFVVPCVSYGCVCAGRALKQLGDILKRSGANILTGAELPTRHSYCDNSDANSLSQRENEAVIELCTKAVSRLEEGRCLKELPMQHFNPLAYIAPRLRAQLGVKLECKNREVCSTCTECLSACPFGAINKSFKANRKCFRCGACVVNCKIKNKSLKPKKLVQKYLNKYKTPSKNSRIY